MKGLGYIRCSTNKQATQGVSLQVQRQKIEEYARFKGIELFEIIEDAGISGGTNGERDGFMQLLERIQEGDVECLILFSLERVSRDLLTGLAFERYLNEYDVILHTVDGATVDCSSIEGYSAFVLKMLFGEIERRTTQSRVKKALDFKKANGKVSGVVPYGYLREGDNLIKHHEEQKVITFVRGCYGNGMRVANIQKELTKKKISTRTGKEWQAVQVQRLLEDYQKVNRKPQTKTGEVIRAFIQEIA